MWFPASCQGMRPAKAIPWQKAVLGKKLFSAFFKDGANPSLKT